MNTNRNRLQIIIFLLIHVASLAIVVMISGELFFFFFQKLHKFNNIQYVAVTQNINNHLIQDCMIVHCQIYT